MAQEDGNVDYQEPELESSPSKSSLGAAQSAVSLRKISSSPACSLSAGLTSQTSLSTSSGEQHSSASGAHQGLPCSRFNAFLDNIVLGINGRVMQTGECLSNHLPDPVLQWLAPIPDDEREPFKLHQPSKMSLCFFGLNLALLVLGTTLVVLGALALADPSKLNFLTSFDPKGRLTSLDLGGFLENVVPFMILMGVCMLGLGYLGTLGCLLGQRQMLRAYARIVMLTIAFQALGALVWFVLRTQFYDHVAGKLKASLKKDYDGTSNSSSSFSQLVDLVQVYYRCCGVESYTDFEGSPWYQRVNAVGFMLPNGTTGKYRFPATCCKRVDLSVKYVWQDAALADKDCLVKKPAISNPYTSAPCLRAIVASILDQIFVIVGAAITVVGLEITTISNAKSIVGALDKEFAKQRKERSKNDPSAEGPTEENA